jgi:hypothetical protein
LPSCVGGRRLARGLRSDWGAGQKLHYGLKLAPRESQQRPYRRRLGGCSRGVTGGERAQDRVDDPDTSWLTTPITLGGLGSGSVDVATDDNGGEAVRSGVATDDNGVTATRGDAAPTASVLST